eukprot:150297-Heterocapsa_arctica.AAC.1
MDSEARWRIAGSTERRSGGPWTTTGTDCDPMDGTSGALGGRRFHAGDIHHTGSCGDMEAGPDGRHQSMGLQDGGGGEGRVDGLQQGQVRREVRDRPKD